MSEQRSSTPVVLIAETLNEHWRDGQRLSSMATLFGRQIFQLELVGRTANIQYPAELEPMLPDIVQAMKVCAAAMSNIVSVPWKFDDYEQALGYGENRDGTDESLEARLLADFPPPPTTNYMETQPFVIQDSTGVIGAWYLPGALSEHVQESTESAVREANRTIPNFFHFHDSTRGKPVSQWYTINPENQYGAGHGHISPAVLGREGIPAPSRMGSLYELKTIAFLQQVAPALCVQSAIMGVMHPLQVEHGFTLQRRLAETVEVYDRQIMLDLFQWWPTAFPRLHIIANREDIIRRDMRSQGQAVHLMATFGTYNNGVLSLPAFQLRCLFNPGTVCGIMYNIFPTGVSAVNGERFAFHQSTQIRLSAFATPELVRQGRLAPQVRISDIRDAPFREMQITDYGQVVGRTDIVVHRALYKGLPDFLTST